MKLFKRILRRLQATGMRTRIIAGVVVVILAVGIGFSLAQADPKPKVVTKKTPAKVSKPVVKKPTETKPVVTTTPVITPAAPVVATKNYTYCVAVDGVDAANLPEFSAKLASVYADARGWSLGGQVSFTKVDSGCSLKVWLAAADRMPNYGAICDSTWSCTVHPNVIINYDRWANASDAWNSAGGSLDNYRSMVINHETGHWFGFQHKYCAGAGQPAPVMQQQSISLQGCAMNSWPLPSEIAQLRSSLGL